MVTMGSIKRYVATIVMVFCSALCIGAADARDPSHWSAVWATALVHSPVPVSGVRPSVQTAPRLHDQTLRQMVVLSAGGSRIRIRLSNAFGTRPLHIDAASVGVQRVGNKNGQLDASSLHALHFDGRSHVVLPPGAARYSDPVDLPVREGDTLGISLYVAGTVAASTWHPDARWNNLISTQGNHAMAAIMPVAVTTGATMWLSAVDVQADAQLPVLVALGDSITNGFRSTVGAAHSYPQMLARRLHGMKPICRVAVVDVGIDGNEMSDRDGGYGPGQGMERRFKRDVLGQPGARFVLLLGGVNDIGEPAIALHARGKALDDMTARRIVANVIEAQQEIINQAHAVGLRIFGATILPFEGTQGAYSATGERARQQVNDWIRHRAPFDGVVDFDKVMRDPSHPLRLRSDIDSGDHIHPNDEGYATMAAAVPPSLLGCKS